MTESSALIGPHAPGVMDQAVEDDLIIFNPKTESYYTLNRTAREVWELADGTRSAKRSPNIWLNSTAPNSQP